MAYHLGGTFNKSQFDRFAAFARAQTSDILGRIKHLTAERIRIGSLVFTYENGQIAKKYQPDSPSSYLGRLIACYEILGGNALDDLNIRSLSQPVYLLPGDETRPAQQLSNGEIMGLPGLGDGPSANLMQQARAWMPETLHYKRDYLERKIRRMIDYSDQLKAESDLLQKIAAAKESGSSLEYILDQITQLLADPTYMAATDDKGADPSGLLNNAPPAVYQSGPDTQASDVWDKQQDGQVLVPGESKA